MRQVCNVAFAVLAEQMDAKEFRHFKAMLPAPPGQESKSRNVGDLMAMMGRGRRRAA